MAIEPTALNFNGSGGIKLTMSAFGSAYPLKTTLSRANKLSFGKESIFGETSIVDSLQKCKLFFFDKNFNLEYTMYSDDDGKFSTNRINNYGQHYVICVSLDESECPEITNLITAGI